jgi:flagellar biosynthesis/type III secretory pathway M-ring protein FliF/YscJ
MNNKHATLDELKRNALAALAVIGIVSIGAMIYMGVAMTRTQSRSTI